MRVGGVLPARLIGVEEDAFHLRPESLRMAADRRRRHHAGVRPPAREQPLHVVARHQHVAVGHHDPVVGGGAPALEHIVELRIGADALVADQEPGRDVRMLGDQAAHQRDDRIARGRRAEQDLVARIVEREGRAQRRFDEIVDAADRADDRDRRRIVRRRQVRAAGSRQRTMAMAMLPRWKAMANPQNADAAQSANVIRRC